jgi:hypothetical protein
MNVEQLQALIDANGGSVDGYFLTVMQGDVIESIDVQIRAVTGGFASGPPELAALILFDSVDPDITSIGGIASGMSGSPLFVDDSIGPDDSLVGAVSYGDWFTLNGTGLATPIDAMSAIEDDYPMEITGYSPLVEPVEIDGRLISSVVVAPNPAKLKSASENGTLHQTPRSHVPGWAQPQQPVSRRAKKHIEANGGPPSPRARAIEYGAHLHRRVRNGLRDRCTCRPRRPVGRRCRHGHLRE